MTKRELRSVLYREIGRLLPAFLCNREEARFTRPINGGRQQILLPIVDRTPQFTFSLVLGIRVDVVEDIFNRYSGVEAASQSETLTTLTQLSYFVQKDKAEFRVRTEDQAVTAVEKLSGGLADKCLAFLDRNTTVEALDVALNSGRDPQFDTTANPYRAMHAVIVARLACNPEFERLTAEHATQMQKFPTVHKRKFGDLVSYLRQL